MDTLIRLIGCIVLTCAIIACPACLALILVFDKESSMPLVTIVLIMLCLAEFCGIFSALYWPQERSIN